jgi:hypothetical protein
MRGSVLPAPWRGLAQPATMAATNKCLAQSNKFPTGSNATEQVADAVSRQDARQRGKHHRLAPKTSRAWNDPNREDRRSIEPERVKLGTPIQYANWGMSPAFGNHSQDAKRGLRHERQQPSTAQRKERERSSPTISSKTCDGNLGISRTNCKQPAKSARRSCAGNSRTLLSPEQDAAVVPVQPNSS